MNKFFFVVVSLPGLPAGEPTIHFAWGAISTTGWFDAKEASYAWALSAGRPEGDGGGNHTILSFR